MNNNQDTIFIEGLTAHAVIGAWDWEKHFKRRLVFDIEMGTDVRTAAESDKLVDTVDYQAVSERIIQFTENSNFQLVETLVEQVADTILAEFSVPWIRIKLQKIGALGTAKSVGIAIFRAK